MSFASMLLDTVSIIRQSESIAGRKKVMTSTSVATAVACLFQQLSGDLQLTVLGRWPSATHIVFFSAGQDVLENDILNDGTDNFLVREKAIIDRPGTAHHIECIVEERTD